MLKWNEHTPTRNILLDALIVKYYHFISTVMLKDGHLEIPTQGHIKITMHRLLILYVYSHILFAAILEHCIII